MEFHSYSSICVVIIRDNDRLVGLYKHWPSNEMGNNGKDSGSNGDRNVDSYLSGFDSNKKGSVEPNEDFSKYLDWSKKPAPEVSTPSSPPSPTTNSFITLTVRIIKMA